MTVTVNWGPQAGFADTGTVQSVPGLIDFLFADEEDQTTISFSPTTAVFEGMFNNQLITLRVDGSNLSETENTGTINTFTFYAGSSTAASQVIGTISTTITVAQMNSLFDLEDSGQDNSAIEDYFAAQDWIYNGTNEVDVFLNTFTSSDNVVVRLNGNDLVNLEGGDDFFFAANGDDTVNGGGGFDTIYGHDGNDIIDGGMHADSLFGNDGDDHLIGGLGFDNLHGGDGNDTLDSGSTADRLYGGEGNDLLMGGTNFGLTKDGLYGEAGNDTLYGQAGFDNLYGGDGEDLLDGGDQADNLYAGTGNDTMMGGQGLDRLFGGNDNDIGHGGAGNDGMFGERGNDTLYGEDGNDRFFGGQGNDLMFGGADSDTVYGGAGFDTIDGGIGNDSLKGDFNADTFVFANGHGNDTVLDFAATNIFEKIDLSGVSAITDLSDLMSNHMSQVGGNVLIDTGAGNSIQLNGVILADLDSTDFTFG